MHTVAIISDSLCHVGADGMLCTHGQAKAVNAGRRLNVKRTNGAFHLFKRILFVFL